MFEYNVCTFLIHLKFTSKIYGEKNLMHELSCYITHKLLECCLNRDIVALARRRFVWMWIWLSWARCEYVLPFDCIFNIEAFFYPIRDSVESTVWWSIEFSTAIESQHKHFEIFNVSFVIVVKCVKFELLWYTMASAVAASCSFYHFNYFEWEILSKKKIIRDRRSE